MCMRLVAIVSYYVMKLHDFMPDFCTLRYISITRVKNYRMSLFLTRDVQSITYYLYAFNSVSHACAIGISQFYHISNLYLFYI